MSKVLVTPRSVTRDGHPALERLADAGLEVVFSSPGRFPTEDELIGLLPGCVGYLAGVESITARVLEAADVLEVISRNGTGIDNIDTAAAEEKGIRICRALGRFGAQFNAARNDEFVRKTGPITTDDSKLAVWVICTNEELMIARDTAELVAGR